MAFRTVTYWRTMLTQIGNTTNRRPFATSTYNTPKTGGFAAEAAQQQHPKPSWSIKGDYVPVYVALGLIVLALSFGGHTAMQQFKYSPAVQVSKKKRQEVPEVEEPEYVVGEAKKFIDNSFFRKVAHIQAYDKEHQNSPDSMRGDVYTRPVQAENLKSTGATQ
ncbi:hypothetical protein ACHQM5_025975 [Ranunculus cassubicifolius]